MTEPYYSDTLCTIFHGDCLDILPTLGDVDLVFTSPPYNLGTHPTGVGSGMHAGSGYSANGKIWNRVADLADGYTDYDDARTHGDYTVWQQACVTAMWRCLSETGAVFYNHKPRPMLGRLQLPLEYGAGLPLRQIITWDRGVGMNFSTSFFLPKSEWIVVWAKPAWRLVSREVAALGDVWHVPPEAGTDHPAPFPLALPSMAIAATAPRLVCDPFVGSGTTLRAAKDRGIRAVGIDTSERYCEIAARRLAQEVLPL